MDCRARWERLGGFKGAEDERRALWSATKSLEDDLHAAGFDTGGYRFQIRPSACVNRMTTDAAIRGANIFTQHQLVTICDLRE